MSKVLTAPNVITIFRIFLVLPITISLINEQFEVAAVLFIIASLSDALDGFIARKFNKITEIGAILDPLADKLLLNYSFIVLTVEKYIPQILLGVILLKDLILISGSVIEVLSAKSISQIKIKASLSGKLSTLMQVIVILLIFLKIFHIYTNTIVFKIFIYLTIILATISLILYINQYKKRMINKEVQT